MRITDEVYLVGSGIRGLGLTDRYDCNVYLIDGGNDELALVDAGAGVTGVEYILANIEAHGYRRDMVTTLLLTHSHVDHAGGVAEMQSKLSSLKVYCHQKEMAVLNSRGERYLGYPDFVRAGLFPPNVEAPPFEPDIELTDFDEIESGTARITSLHLPGHTPGSVCFLFRGRDGMYLFSGDSVMLGGRTYLINSAGSSLRYYRSSLKKLSGLGVDSLLPGHGGFCVNYGQEHIDKAIKAFSRLELPPNFEI